RPTVSTPMTARSIKKRSNALFESDDGTDSLHGSTCVPSLVDLPSPLLGDLVPRPWDLGPCPGPQDWSQHGDLYQNSTGDRRLGATERSSSMRPRSKGPSRLPPSSSPTTTRRWGGRAPPP